MTEWCVCVDAPVQQNHNDPELDWSTLATALLDVDGCTVTIMTGNPATAPVQEAVWDVTPCTKKGK